MKVLVINGSPRKARGATHSVASLFTDGMKEAGADVEIIHSRALEIGDCRGCYNCWGATPGKCIQDDDMTEVLSKMANADILVLATPVYVDGMTGLLKTLLDRSIPLIHGRIEIREDHCRHPPRYPVEQSKLVLVSVSGFTEIDNFDPLITHVKAISKNISREYAGAVLRPVAWAMQGAKEQGVPLDDIYDAVKEAGRQLITNGSMKKETLATIAREYMPRDVVVQIMQGAFKGK